MMLSFRGNELEGTVPLGIGDDTLDGEPSSTSTGQDHGVRLTFQSEALLTCKSSHQHLPFALSACSADLVLILISALRLFTMRQAWSIVNAASKIRCAATHNNIEKSPVPYDILWVASLSAFLATLRTNKGFLAGILDVDRGPCRTLNGSLL